MLGAAWKKSPLDALPCPLKLGSSRTIAFGPHASLPPKIFHVPSGLCFEPQRWLSTTSPRTCKRGQ